MPATLLAPNLVLALVAGSVERLGRRLSLVNPLERVESSKELAPAFYGTGLTLFMGWNIFKEGKEKVSALYTKPDNAGTVSSKPGLDTTQLSRRIEVTDIAIDTLVYELYWLTDEEITIVEGSGK